MQNQWFVILNPRSGQIGPSQKSSAIEKAFRENGLSCHIQQTEFHQHAIELTREAIQQGYRKIVAAGGDGTMHEVVNGIMRQEIVPSHEVLLGIIPLGTGNDWAKTLKVKPSIPKSVERLKRGKTILQDVGSATYQEGGEQKQRYFMNVAGIGYDSFVASQYLSKDTRKSKMSYLVGGIRGLWSYQNVELKLRIEEKEMTHKVFLLAAGVGKFFANGMMIAPKAVLDDGLLDITVVRDVNKMDVLLALPGLYSGKIIGHPKIDFYQSNRVEIEAPSGMLQLEADGELLGHTPVTIELCPAALQVIVGN